MRGSTRKPARAASVTAAAFRRSVGLIRSSQFATELLIRKFNHRGAMPLETKALDPSSCGAGVRVSNFNQGRSVSKATKPSNVRRDRRARVRSAPNEPCRQPPRKIVAYTVAVNAPSRRVMERIGMTHDPSDDFDHKDRKPNDPHRRHVVYRKRRDER